MVRHFVYEEFHPNERLYAEKTVEFFIHTYFNEEWNDNLASLCRDDAWQYVKDFYDLYERFKLNKYELISSNIKKLKGILTANIDFESFVGNSMKSHKYQGELEIEVRRRKGQWQISQLRFPKLS